MKASSPNHWTAREVLPRPGLSEPWFSPPQHRGHLRVVGRAAGGGAQGRLSAGNAQGTWRWQLVSAGRQSWAGGGEQRAAAQIGSWSPPGSADNVALGVGGGLGLLQGALPRPGRQQHLAGPASLQRGPLLASESPSSPPDRLLCAGPWVGRRSRSLWAFEALPVKGEVMAGRVTRAVTKAKSCSPPYPVPPPDRGLAHTKGRVT